jgi:2-C-methyl-D-erythritol 4-phosphate cytidylyltransferase
VKDTIKKGENGLITETVDRESLYQIQTPQTFYKQLYLKAYNSAQMQYSDDCQLIEAIGGKVALSQGSYSNIKLTTEEDFAVASALLKRMEAAK